LQSLIYEFENSCTTAIVCALSIVLEAWLDAIE
jgi:hypothetical protein